MTNTKAGNSLPIPLLLLKLCAVKHLKRDGFTAEVTNIPSAYMVLPASFISVFLAALLPLARLLFKLPCSSLLALLCVYKQGDLKRYLRAQRKSDGMTPDLPTRDLLTLQRMAFEITSGLLHLHENNYIHRSVMKSSNKVVSLG